MLEDIGHEGFDNLPLSLLPALIENAAADAPAIAVGASACTRGFAIESVLETFDIVVRRTAWELKVPLIDCDDERLERRYTETRRPTLSPATVRSWMGSGSSAKRSPPARPC